jgi:flagellar FliL protein
MSDEPKEAKDSKDAPPADGAAAAAGAPAKAAPPVVLIAVVALALSAGGALGALLVAPKIIHARQAAAAEQLADPHGKKAKKKKKTDKKGEEGKPTVYKLDNLIVNPADSQGQRFLMCTVAVTSDDPHALDVLREHEIELRDHVITLLSHKTMDRLTSEGARDTLRAELLNTVIKPVLGADAEDTELKVYLPQFVVQ